jgi:avirulence protein
VLPFGVTNAVGGVFLGAGAATSALTAGFDLKGKLEGDKTISWGDVALSSLGVIPGARLSAVTASLDAGEGVARTALNAARFTAGSLAAGAAGFEVAKAGTQLLQGKIPSVDDLLLTVSLAAGHVAGRNAQTRFDISKYAVVRQDDFDTASSYGPAAYAFSTKAAQDIKDGRITSADQLWDAARAWRAGLAKVTNASEGSLELFFRGRDPNDVQDNAVTPLTGKYLSIAPKVAAEFPALGELGGHLGTIHGVIDGKTLDLTTFTLSADEKSGLIFHTDPSNLPLIQRQVEDLYRHALDPKTSRADVIKTAAEMHWWLVQALPDPRGSAAKADVFVRSVLEARGIQVPPWKKGVVPDLQALASPESEFVAAYSNYFSRPL